MSNFYRFLVLFLVLVGSATAQPNHAWVLDSNADAHIITFKATDAGGTIMGTDTGFRVRSWPQGWLIFEEPGVPHRAVYTAAVLEVWPGYLTGRLDADGHGYLEHDTAAGPGTVVYNSSCGAFVDIVGYDSSFDPGPLWACSRAGETPGELVVSVDHGHTWTVVTGHGHADLYDLYMSYIDPSLLFVVGDAGIMVTADDGLTWRDLSGGLPEVAVRRLQEDALWTDLPGKSPWTMGLWACTDGGLFAGRYDQPSGDHMWDAAALIAEPVESVGFFHAGEGIDGALAITDSDRVLLDNRAWHWVDITDQLAGFDLLPVGVLPLVATAHDGLWSLTGLTTAVDDLPTAPTCRLHVAPNPFNPATSLRYEVPAACRATLRVYDLAGRLVVTLLDDDVAAGTGEVEWRPRDLGAGVYVARLVAGEWTTTQKVALVR